MSEKQQRVLNFLDDMNIKYKLIKHIPVYTIDDMEKLDTLEINNIPKNLFLRNDKGSEFFIVVMQKDKKANLKQLRQVLNCRPLSFASEEYLQSILGLEKGSVTPLGVINDTANSVTAVLDKDIASQNTVGVHPNENTATVFLSFDDLISVINACGNKAVVVEIPQSI